MNCFGRSMENTRIYPIPADVQNKNGELMCLMILDYNMLEEKREIQKVFCL